MGSSFSTSNGEGSGPVTGLGDLPENCLAIILANLDPPDICNLARTNKSFHRASAADFIWEPKLPENYRTLAEKLMFYEGCSEAEALWVDKERGGICMLISWKGMKITGIDDRRYWSHIPTLQS
ncbi:F-box domain, cyclin-like protein, partial [Tanacetum coccineum]